ADKGTAFPAAAGVGGIADAELLLLGQRRLFFHAGRRGIGRARGLRVNRPRHQQPARCNRKAKETPAIHVRLPLPGDLAPLRAPDAYSLISRDRYHHPGRCRPSPAPTGDSSTIAPSLNRRLGPGYIAV